MHYVQLADDIIILSTSKGVFTLNQYTFNFNKIIELVKAGSAEDLVLTLLEKPDTPNGTYFVYLDTITRKIFISHKKDDTETISVLGSSNELDQNSFSPAEYTFLGVYISVESIYEDWPEYAL